jgi:hypothetical protein
VRERTWSYKNFRIVEGLKAGSSHFQYFFVVSEKGEKKCNYCVWIDNDHLDRFGRSEGFEEIASSQREKWSKWVQEKIDQRDFSSKRVVKRRSILGQRQRNLHLNKRCAKKSFA